MLGKKTGAELDREIDMALSREPARRAVGEGYKRFRDLVKLNEPGAMEIAEDAILNSGGRIRDATGGLRARNFTIEMRPTHGPRDEWKMVQVSVDATGKPGVIWTKWSVANGPHRVYRERNAKGELVESKQQGVATAWAIAKAIKMLPLNTGEEKLAEIVDRVLARGKKNMTNPQLF